MVLVYLLINCELGSETEIIKQMSEIPEIIEVRGTLGVFDIFAKIQTDSREKLDEIMTDKIRKIRKIQSTNTLTMIKYQGGR